MQFRLRREYRGRCCFERRPACTGIHRRPPLDALKPRTRWTPSPCGRLSRPPTSTSPPPHLIDIDRRRVFPRSNWLLDGAGVDEVVPTFTLQPLDRRGVQLCPCGIATTTPQTFIVASRTSDINRPGSSSCTARECAPQPSPD